MRDADRCQIGHHPVWSTFVRKYDIRRPTSELETSGEGASAQDCMRRTASTASERASASLCQQVNIRKMGGKIATQREIAIAAISAKSANLDRTLVDVDVVDLIGHGRRMGTCDRDIDGCVDRDADIDQAAGKIAVSAITCAIRTGRDRVGAAPQA